MKTGYTYHCNFSVRGLLSKGPRDFKRAIRGVFRAGDGSQATPEQVRSWLFDHLSQGHEKIPAAPEPCSAWDWKEGCTGHPPEAR